VSMTNSSDRVEIITSVQRRRRWTAPEKVRMVEETFVARFARISSTFPNRSHGRRAGHRQKWGNFQMRIREFFSGNREI
jgi:hypothetical protein